MTPNAGTGPLELITAPRPLKCPECRARVLKRRTLPYKCPKCYVTFCPFCWKPATNREGSYMDKCEHIFANGSTESGWWLEPYDDTKIPHLETIPEGRAWSQKQKASAFGDLLPLLQAYEDSNGLDWRPERRYLLDQLIEFHQLPVLISFRIDAVMGELQAEFDYFAADADSIREQLTGALDELRLGFNRLAAMDPEESALPDPISSAD